MEFAPFQTLTTERLLLRKLRWDDAEGYFCFAGSETVTRYMLWKPHAHIAESISSIEKALRRYEEGGYYRWAISRKEDDGIIGIIDLLNFNEEKDSCSFAYMLGEVFWGRGYGTEAAKAVLGFAFDVLKVDAVEVDHMAENVASGAVMRKAGMKYIRTDIAKYEKNGILQDAPVYRITAAEWKNDIS